jgi:hypothetical protein
LSNLKIDLNPHSLAISAASCKCAPTVSAKCESEPIVKISPPKSLYSWMILIEGSVSFNFPLSPDVLISMPMFLSIAFSKMEAMRSLHSLKSKFPIVLIAYRFNKSKCAITSISATFTK